MERRGCDAPSCTPLVTHPPPPGWPGDGSAGHGRWRGVGRGVLCCAACGIAALRLREAGEAPCRPCAAQAGIERQPCSGSGRGCRPHACCPGRRGAGITASPFCRRLTLCSLLSVQNLPALLSYLIPCREALTERNWFIFTHAES